MLIYIRRSDICFNVMREEGGNFVKNWHKPRLSRDNIGKGVYPMYHASKAHCFIEPLE